MNRSGLNPGFAKTTVCQRQQLSRSPVLYRTVPHHRSDRNQTGQQKIIERNSPRQRNPWSSFKIP